jgi:hypothetical protein
MMVVVVEAVVEAEIVTVVAAHTICTPTVAGVHGGAG